jgi:heme A synthase
LGSAGTAETWSWGSGLASLAAVLAMLLAKTSSTSRIPPADGRTGGRPVAVLSVGMLSIQVHTGGLTAFSQQGKVLCNFQEDLQRPVPHKIMLTGRDSLG